MTFKLLFYTALASKLYFKSFSSVYVVTKTCKAMRNWLHVSGSLDFWNWCVRATNRHNTKLIFNTVHFYCLCIVDVCLMFVLRIFKILKDQWAMHSPLQCIVYVLQAGMPKWVRAQDPKHRINYARPNAQSYWKVQRAYFFQCTQYAHFNDCTNRR
jgi:hypothetical protein